MEQIIIDLEKLQQPSEPLTFLSAEGAKTEEGNEIVSKLKEVMNELPDLLALAAPQIGINKRIFCLRFNDQVKTFINPIITKKNGLKITVETCASMPGKEIVIDKQTLINEADGISYINCGKENNKNSFKEKIKNFFNNISNFIHNLI